MTSNERVFEEGVQLPGPDEDVIVGRLLGRGGFSEVYLATGLRTGKKYALKVLRSEHRRKWKDLERLRREGQTLLSVRHDNLLAVYHIGIHQDGTTVYLVMQLMLGRTVRQFIRDRTAVENLRRLADGRQPLTGDAPMPVIWALEIMLAASNALAALHVEQVVHRDLKPENMDLEPNGTVLLFDVGIGVFSGVSRLTTHGTSLGTLTYMSPEQVMGSEQIDHRSDLFSLGSVLFELVSGAAPFAATGDSEPNQKAQMLRILHTPHRSLRTSTAQHIPDHLNDLVDQLLQKAPEARPVSAERVGDLLAEILDDELARLGEHAPPSLANALENIPSSSTPDDPEAESLDIATPRENPYVTISLPQPAIANANSAEMRRPSPELRAQEEALTAADAEESLDRLAYLPGAREVFAASPVRRTASVVRLETRTDTTKRVPSLPEPASSRRRRRPPTIEVRSLAERGPSGTERIPATENPEPPAATERVDVTAIIAAQSAPTALRRDESSTRKPLRVRRSWVYFGVFWAVWWGGWGVAGLLYYRRGVDPTPAVTVATIASASTAPARGTNPPPQDPTLTTSAGTADTLARPGASVPLAGPPGGAAPLSTPRVPSAGSQTAKTPFPPPQPHQRTTGPTYGAIPEAPAQPPERLPATTPPERLPTAAPPQHEPTTTPAHRLFGTEN